MGSPSVQDGARHFSPAELDVTLVASRSSGSEGLSERWMIIRRDEFSIGINQSKNNSRNIDNSINPLTAGGFVTPCGGEKITI